MVSNSTGACAYSRDAHLTIIYLDMKLSKIELYAQLDDSFILLSVKHYIYLYGIIKIDFQNKKYQRGDGIHISYSYITIC